MSKRYKVLQRWEIQSERLSLTLVETDDGLAWLEEARDPFVLSHLAKLFYPTVSRIALDAIFTYWFDAPDWRDAARAYTGAPLDHPPEEYLEFCRRHDFRLTHPYQLSAIVLAGSCNTDDQRLLLSILDQAPGDARDGPLWAASASSDRRIIQKVAEICMSMEKHDSTGDLNTCIQCFYRWWRQHLFDGHELMQLLRKYESTKDGMVKAEEVKFAIVDGNSV